MDSGYIEFDVNRLLPMFMGAKQLQVDYDTDKYARTKDPELEKQIEQIWKKKTENNDRIYNASKFRFHNTLQGDNDKVVIQVGITNYKDLLGTHYTTDLPEVLKTCQDPYLYMSNAIGVGAITETSDGWVALVRRAGWTGEHAGWVDRPGGHPEPDLVEEEMEKATPDVAINKDTYAGLDPEIVLKHILESPQHELRDEANIPLENQSHLGLLGIIRDESHGGRVGFDSHISTDLTKEQLEKRYLTGTQSEADESTGLVFVKSSDVANWTLDRDLLKRMTPHCRGGLRLLHIKMNRENEGKLEKK